jgi:hypothetical protein
MGLTCVGLPLGICFSLDPFFTSSAFSGRASDRSLGGPV